MAGTVPVDAAALRAAVADDRYWQTSHPENAAWRSWVADGYQAVYGGQREQGGVVHVRAYTRNRDGHTEHVRAHTRSDPPGGEGGQGMAVPLTWGMRRNLLEFEHVTPVARRPGQGRLGGEIPTPFDSPFGGPPGPGAGGGGRSPAIRPPTSAQPRSAARPAQNNRVIEFSPGQSGQKIKHAETFGLPYSAKPENLARFEQAVRGHVQSPATVRIEGTYRGQPSIHFLNPETGINVMTRPGGQFWSAWRRSLRQLQNVLQRGAL